MIRLVAFSAGVALIPATYTVGRALYDAPTGLLASAFVAASEHLIEYSTNGRGYTLPALLRQAGLRADEYAIRPVRRFP